MSGEQKKQQRRPRVASKLRRLLKSIFHGPQVDRKPVPRGTGLFDSGSAGIYMRDGAAGVAALEQVNISRATYERDADALQKTITISYWSTIISVFAVVVSAVAVVVSLSRPTVVEVYVETPSAPTQASARDERPVSH